MEPEGVAPSPFESLMLHITVCVTVQWPEQDPGVLRVVWFQIGPTYAELQSFQRWGQYFSLL